MQNIQDNTGLRDQVAQESRTSNPIAHAAMAWQGGPLEVLDSFMGHLSHAAMLARAAHLLMIEAASSGLFRDRGPGLAHLLLGRPWSAVDPSLVALVDKAAIKSAFHHSDNRNTVLNDMVMMPRIIDMARRLDAHYDGNGRPLAQAIPVLNQGVLGALIQWRHALGLVEQSLALDAIGKTLVSGAANTQAC